MAQKILTDTAMEGYRTYTETTISHKARYRLTTGSWVETNVESLRRAPDGRILVDVDVSPGAADSVTVAEVQLLDYYGRPWAKTTEQVTIENLQEGILWEFSFNIIEQPI